MNQRFSIFSLSAKEIAAQKQDALKEVPSLLLHMHNLVQQVWDGGPVIEGNVALYMLRRFGMAPIQGKNDLGVYFITTPNPKILLKVILADHSRCSSIFRAVISSSLFEEFMKECFGASWTSSYHNAVAQNSVFATLCQIRKEAFQLPFQNGAIRDEIRASCVVALQALLEPVALGYSNFTVLGKVETQDVTEAPLLVDTFTGA